MSRFFPALAGLALILAGGLAHGLWTDRWGLSDEPAASAEKLDHVARQVGDWVGEDAQAIRATDLAIGEISNYLSRTYKHKITGKALRVLMVCGKPQAISVHTPDVCFVGGGQDMVRKEHQEIPLSAAAPPFDCFVGHFRYMDGDQQVMTRVYWSWSADGVWKAPSGPRYAFARYRALYKLYVIPNVLEDDKLDAGYAVDFLKVFIPELDRTLFGKSDNSAAP
jgi:hypothetical protein